MTGACKYSCSVADASLPGANGLEKCNVAQLQIKHTSLLALTTRYILEVQSSNYLFEFGSLSISARIYLTFSRQDV